MINKPYYIDETLECTMCGKEFNPMNDHNRKFGKDEIDVEIPSFYVNNFCSAECVKDMDELQKELK